MKVMRKMTDMMIPNLAHTIPKILFLCQGRGPATAAMTIVH
jgi:hypothetical protein